MADPVNLVLEFLQKNQFAQAEAAFKAELQSRSKIEETRPSPQIVLDNAIASNIAKSLHGRPANGPVRNDDTPPRTSSTPPEKQLYVEYECKTSESQSGHTNLGYDTKNPKPTAESPSVISPAGLFISPSTIKHGMEFWSESSNSMTVPSQAALYSNGVNLKDTEPTSRNLEKNIKENGPKNIRENTESTGKDFNLSNVNTNGFIAEREAPSPSVHKSSESTEKQVIIRHPNDLASVRESENKQNLPMADIGKQEHPSHSMGELPRLPPVRLHSIDKNMEAFKDAVHAAENDSSNKNLESSAFRSTESVTESAAPLDTMSSLQINNDLPSSGFKRLITRPSVSQGIIEDMAEHMSDFATPADGQSDRWYPDDYCDSDGWEDDDDPGYHRQPIEDEEWFLSNEIDYPSDDERSRHQTAKVTMADSKKSKNHQSADHTFVDEESFFSGEEYCKLKDATKDMDPTQLTYSDLYSKNDISGIDDDINDYGSQMLDSEELKLVKSQSEWKGFIYQGSELKHGGLMMSIPDEDNHESVRSGGIHPSSDIADIGSEVRDSLLGCSSEGDTESFRELSTDKKSGHVSVDNNALSQPDDEYDDDEEERNVVLQYYNEEWGHSKNADRENALRKSKSGRNGKSVLDNGGFEFEGFSFPSPSSTGDIVGSTAESGKSLWSNRGSTAQAEETDEYVSGIVGPDDTLAAWKRKSNDSSPAIGSGEENAQTVKEGCNVVLQPACQPSAHDEDGLVTEEEMRAMAADEDDYEIFDLRIIHRKNRTGFEEEKDFPVVINSVIAGRYHVTEYLGSAAFSKAIQAHDLQTGMDVCMKIIKNNKDFFDQSLDEIKLLKYINKHDPADKHHILRLYDYFYHREHLFIICELLRANLYEFQKFNRESGGEVYFTMPRLQSISIQCLEALEFLHKMGIIHCDLKPENILVKSYSRCEIKIIDLGSSCFRTDHLCSYVQSRSYRAPEVILGLPYDQKIDIWSLGCILAELCTGNVLFQNDSLATLLARVVGILGPIDPEVLGKGRDTYKYFTKNHMLYERNQDTDQLEYLIPKKTSLTHRLAMGDKGFIEFVGYLLQNNPEKRPTASEALRHPWLSYPYEPISS